LRPPDDKPLRGSTAIALALRQPLGTVKDWLAVWLSLGEDGVRTVRSRGKQGYCYEVTQDFVQRWHRGDVATPHPSLYASRAA
jgi:hypothetical protein